jgi:hypothetical protein
VICLLGYRAPATLFQSDFPSPQFQRQAGEAEIDTKWPDSEKAGGSKLVGCPVQKITGTLVIEPPGGSNPGTKAGTYLIT